MADLPALRRSLVAPLLALACACTDRDPVLPAPQPLSEASLTRIDCSVVVATQQMTCTTERPAASLAGGARGDRIVGGQDVYVKLGSTGTAYDSGTGILASSVTVQNLTRQTIGTPDGSTLSGVYVFLASGPTATSGTGTVTVANPDGSGAFTSAGQDYFLYPQILAPYEISAAKSWQFDVPASVGSFAFRVYLSTRTADEATPLLDAVWQGGTGSDWQVASNWSTGAVPDSASVVAVPADSLLASHVQPVLSADARVLHLRVGAGSTLDQAGFALQVDGNVDAPGSISGGTLAMSGTGALLRGTVGGLRVSGSAALQGDTRATGAVSVTGSMSVKDHALSVSIP